MELLFTFPLAKKQPRQGSKYLPGRSENGTEGGLHLGELFSELGEVVVGEVQVRDEANQVLTKSNGPDAQHFELADVVGGQDRVRELHDDDVRVNGVEVFHLRFLAQHVADVHPGALSDRLETLENLDLVGSVTGTCWCLRTRRIHR